MSDTDTIVLDPDEPPKDGTWVDVHDVLAHPTDDELTEGARLGDEVLPETAPEPDQLVSMLGFTATRATTSDRDQALAEARKLKAALLAAGVPEVQIQLLPGRPNGYGQWNALFAVADMSHHIVSRYSSSNLTPGLALVRTGRSDLPGPLCNAHGGFDLCARIITMGYANHPGQGGPITVPATTVGRFTIPRDSARRYTFGWEYEGGLAVADWDRVLTNPRTGDRMTFREFMDRCNAGTQDYLNIPTGAHLEHSTWAPGRKIDRLGITRAAGITGLTRYRAANRPKQPAPTKQEEPKVDTYTGRTVTLGTFNLAGVTQSSEKSTDNLLSALPAVDLAFMQEALKVKVRKALSKLLGVHQDLTSAATRGVAIAWDKQTVEKDGRKRVTLGSRRAPGVRDRHLIHVDVDLEDRLTVRAIAGHRPLKSTGRQDEFDDTLRQLVDTSPHPVIVGIDCNDRDPDAWAKSLGLRWHGKGIDGFAVTPGIKLVNVRRQKATGSDHRPVTAVLQVGPSRKATKR